MRHRKKVNLLGRKAGHRKAMMANMSSSLIKHKRKETTVPKAKALRVYVEPLITKSKNDTTHSRRTVFAYLKDKEAVSELFRVVAPKVADRPGGYTRIVKTGFREGDGADMAIIELVDFNEAALAGTTKKEEKKVHAGAASSQLSRHRSCCRRSCRCPIEALTPLRRATAPAAEKASAKHPRKTRPRKPLPSMLLRKFLPRKLLQLLLKLPLPPKKLLLPLRNPHPRSPLRKLLPQRKLRLPPRNPQLNKYAVPATAVAGTPFIYIGAGLTSRHFLFFSCLFLIHLLPGIG